MRISFSLFLLLALTIAGCGAGGSSVGVATPIAVYTAAPTDQPTVQPAQAPATPTAEATATPTPQPTEAPAATATSEPSPTPTVEAIIEPTVEATATPTSEATAKPIPTETETPTATATSVPPTATPEAEPEAEIDPIYTGLPEEILALMPAADAQRGEALTISNACSACHSLQKDVRVVGPSWYSVGRTAGERVPGQNAGLYLYTSIVEPNAYINESYVAGLMPQTYSAVLSSEQIADIIAYLLTLRGE